MYTITKQFSFDASHQLFDLPEGHKCSRLHGHTYRVEIILKSTALNEVGFIIDYGDLSPLKDYIDSTLDHRHLNDVFDFQPSAENIAHHLYSWCSDRWPETYEVKISETPKTWASYNELSS